MPVATDALKGVPLFRDLPKKSLERVASRALPISYGAGEVVFRQGDPGLGFFVVVSGKVSITHGGTEAARLGPGGSFGEMALLDSHPRSATVTAVEPTECLSINRADFLKELREQPDIAFELLANLSRRVRDLDERVRHLSSSVPAEWLA
jgi:CRP-like cAMP-binding protein